MIQYNFLLAYYNNKILYNKLINIYQNNKAYKFTYYKTSNILSTIINDLQASIIIYKYLKKLGVYYKDYSLKLDNKEVDTYYIDYKY